MAKKHGKQIPIPHLVPSFFVSLPHSPTVKSPCSHHFPMLNHLVGGFNPSKKYESQLGLLFPIYGKSFKIPWFQTTNQSAFSHHYPMAFAPNWRLHRGRGQGELGHV
jgi:hypothetical protein